MIMPELSREYLQSIINQPDYIPKLDERYKFVRFEHVIFIDDPDWNHSTIVESAERKVSDVDDAGLMSFSTFFAPDFEVDFHGESLGIRIDPKNKLAKRQETREVGAKILDGFAKVRKPN